MSPPLPESLEDVTPAWLQQAVNGHPAFRGAHITQARTTPLGAGVGQMSALARVELSYRAKRGPPSVVVKLHTTFPAMRDVGVRYEMFARETAFYNSLARKVSVTAPTMYFAGWDPALKRNALVMQDMTKWHWPDQLDGPTLFQAQSCVDAIAKVNAGHWGADFSGQPWLPDTRAPVLRQVVEDFRLSTPHALSKLHAFVTPSAQTACLRILDKIDWIWEAMAKAPLVLTHYDCRLENFVFAGPKSKKLALIDWQLMARLRPGWDIAYFLGTSLTDDQRRAWQGALKTRYLKGLRRGGVRKYGAADFEYDFALSAMANTIIPVIGGAACDASNERNVTLFGTILQRSLTSVLDNKCLELLPP